MKKTALLLLLSGCAGFSLAQDVGRVLSATPVVQQVGVPRTVCSTQAVATEAQRSGSGAGALVGAIAGGAMGNAVGMGGGRAAATMLGLIGGAIVGDRIEGQGQVQNVQQCGTQTAYESRTVGYNVVYEFAGKQYNVQMPNDPGPTVQLQVTPVAMSGPAMAPQSGSYTQPMGATYIEPQPVYVAVAPTVVYPAYYGRPYFAPIGLNLHLGYYGGGGHGPRRWR